VSKRDPDFDPVSAKIMLWMQCGGRCMFCGQALGNDGDMHHRKLRSQGGSNDEVNLALIHRRCHAWAHMNPEQAYILGWLVHGWSDPAEVPITTGTPWSD
jgi:5-methylcytosine-specific restriction endonuclease McrA